MKKPAPGKNMPPPPWDPQLPSGITHFRGFRLLGTALGFHRNPKAPIIFRAHPDAPTPRRDKRHFVAAATGAALGLAEKGLDALMLDFHRSIRLGRLDIQVLPAGMGPTAAQLLINYRDRRILFCDGMRLGDPIAGPNAATPQCDLLLLDFEPTSSRSPSPKRTAQKAVRWAEDVLGQGGTPVMGCGSFLAACDLAWQLQRTDLPLRAARPLFEALRRLEPFGLELPHLRRLEQQIPSDAVVLHRMNLLERAPLKMPSRPLKTAYVGPKAFLPEAPNTSFRLGEPDDLKGLVRFIEKTEVNSIAVGPRVSDTTAIALVKKGFHVHRFTEPTQMSLPDLR